MGGLTALILAHQHSDRVLSFTNIKGNLAPEDCFLSRQIISHPSGDPESFFVAFIDRIRADPCYSTALFAQGLRYKVRPAAVRAIFASMVDLSDHGDLLTKFLTLPFPRMYMYGERFRSLSYLGDLGAAADKGVELAEISHSGHFPMYSNPVEMWSRMADFIARCEAELQLPSNRRDACPNRLVPLSLSSSPSLPPLNGPREAVIDQGNFVVN